ncbi:MAG: cobyrinate a,c-diamide synthase [Candidatus Omnitrophica bacterium]|nr:cobyrinate a,c-diamide synthase [Candidatus Omnitrophota bacterium]
MKHALVVAGTHSGAGKTTATLALLAALHDRAMIVQPFKVGPDYLDPGYHNLFSGGRKSRNLDSFLLSEDYIRASFFRNTHRADVAVVEGVMGMFDGRSAENAEGSTAHLAKILGLPVVLVVDASGAAQSAGATVLGFKQFDPAAGLAGVIFNRVSGPRHYEYLRNSVRPEWGIEVLGYFPDDAEVRIPERHLGLTSALENPLSHSFFDRLKRISDTLDLERLLAISRFERRVPAQEPAGEVCSWSGPGEERRSKVRIGVAYDEAFSFYYEDNFDLLRDQGAELVFFSPLYGNALPENIDALYVGGGFPEMFAPKLSRNLSMIESLQKFAAEKHLIYAECGGLIYLAERFRDRDGHVFGMAGILPGEVEMTPSLQSFGYKELEANADTFLFSRGDKLRSHEFHYSRWLPHGQLSEPPYRFSGGAEGYWSFPVLASYQHLHFGSSPLLAGRFVESALNLKAGCEKSLVE